MNENNAEGLQNLICLLDKAIGPNDSLPTPVEIAAHRLRRLALTDAISKFEKYAPRMEKGHD